MVLVASVQFLTCELGFVFASEGCRALTDETRDALLQYVREKQRVRSGAAIELVEISDVGTTCYRRLQFRSTDESRPFQTTLYLPPDQAFVMPSLFDFRLDPAQEERRKIEEARVALTAGEFPSIGPPDAPVTIVLFSDFQCPFCKTAAEILQRDVLPYEEQSTRLIFRHLPLPMHGWARLAAEAASCAQFQSSEAFWKLHDFLFQTQEELSATNLSARVRLFAESIPGFDVVEYAACLSGKRSSAAVLADVNLASANDITGTPTLFINGLKVQGGVRSAEQLRTLIRQATRANETGGFRP